LSGRTVPAGSAAAERSPAPGPDGSDPVRVLYSFPHRIGRPRIALTAWQQVVGAAGAGAQMTVFPASVVVPLPGPIVVHSTLAYGRLRLPFRVVGDGRMFALHDRIVAQRLASLGRDVDVVHAWPLGARETLKVARRLGVPTVLERANAHTRYAYEVVRAECERLGVALPPDHEHAFNAETLAKEEEEYELADKLLCPSEFVVKTFLEEGFPADKLVRHVYGFDESTFFPDERERPGNRPFTLIFVGVAAVRKGLHFALEAWLASPAAADGVFLVAGEILPEYGRKLEPMLAHPTVQALGHREDVASLMRGSDALVLPSIEEGFGLTCVEAMGSGAVPVVSDACTDVCRHGENALVHNVGDVTALTSHISMLYEDRELLARLRAGALESAPQLTWAKAGIRLNEVYRLAAGLPRRTG
jgi:glycosyltransferase involved in cell wall biosynthesis